MILDFFNVFMTMDYSVEMFKLFRRLPVGRSLFLLLLSTITFVILVLEYSKSRSAKQNTSFYLSLNSLLLIIFIQRWLILNLFERVFSSFYRIWFSLWCMCVTQCLLYLFFFFFFLFFFVFLSVHRSKLQMKTTVDDQHKTLSLDELPMYSRENIEGRSQTRNSSCINLYFNHHQHHQLALKKCLSSLSSSSTSY